MGQQSNNPTIGAIPRARSLDELMNHPARPGIEAGIDVYCDVVIRDGKTKQEIGRHGFQCESFVANFLKMLTGTLRADNREDLTTIDGEVYPGNDVAGSPDPWDSANWAAISTTVSFFPFQGPVIGVGTTAATPGDYKLEKQLTHGTDVQDLSAWSGVVGGSSNPYTIYGTGAAWAADEYNGYFLRMDSGPDSGIEKYIIDTLPTYVSLINYSPMFRRQDYTTAHIGENMTILTYGMITHGSVGFSSPVDDGNVTSTFTITRTFTNSTGVTIDVGEYGLYVGMRIVSSYSNKSVCIIRDVQTPVSLLDTQEMTVTYTFTVVA